MPLVAKIKNIDFQLVWVDDPDTPRVELDPEATQTHEFVDTDDTDDEYKGGRDAGEAMAEAMRNLSKLYASTEGRKPLDYRRLEAIASRLYEEHPDCHGIRAAAPSHKPPRVTFTFDPAERARDFADSVEARFGEGYVVCCNTHPFVGEVTVAPVDPDTLD